MGPHAELFPEWEPGHFSRSRPWGTLGCLTLFLSASLLLSASVRAQAPDHHDPADLRPITRIGTHANSNVDLSPVLPNTQITLGARSQARDPGSPAAPAAFSTVLASPLTSTRQKGARFDWVALAEPGSRAGTAREAFPISRAQRYALRLESPSGIGDLKVSFDVTGQGGADVRASFADFNLAQSFSLADGPRDFVVDDLIVGLGRPFEITLYGDAFGRLGETARYTASLEITFVPNPSTRCTFLPGASSCPPGGALQAFSDGQSVGLDLKGALPRGVSLTVVSPSNLIGALGNAGCNVLIGRPFVVAVFGTDDAGDALQRFALPNAPFTAWVQQVTISFQTVRLGRLQVATSNSLGISCR